ncbi:MAG: transcriptional regulator, partial [Parvibaculaceae bacterium]
MGSAISGRETSLCLTLLGPLAVSRAGVPLTLPASRKARALLASLALSPQAPSRSRLCELLWDVPNDPRGELRWCLSKLRKLL